MSAAAVPTSESATPTTVQVAPFRERFTTCASCRAEARWMVEGTTTCDRHRSTWIRRAEAKEVVR